MLRERGSGTLERLWTTPLHRADLLLGYVTAFTVVAVGQSLILCVVAARFLDVEIAASWAWVVLTALVDAFLGVALGLFVSAFARTEFQSSMRSSDRLGRLSVEACRTPREGSSPAASRAPVHSASRIA